MKKRIFSILLTLAMVLSLLPAAAFAEGENVAKVGDTEYATLAEAVAAAQAGDTVTLLKDVELSDKVVVAKKLTINLGGNTLSRVNTVQGQDGSAITVIADGDLTLENGTVYVKLLDYRYSAITIDTEPTSAYAANAKLTIGADVKIEAPTTYGVTVFGNKSESVTATLVVKGEINAYCAAVSGNGTYWGTDITLDDGAVLTSTDSVAVYHPQKGTLTIKGATITGKGGIEAKSGDSVVTVENAKIKATAEPNHSASSSGTSTEGYAVAVVENSAYQGAPTFTIQNGEFYGPIALLQDNQVVSEKAGSITVNGGSFTDLMSAVKYAASGAEIKLLDDVTLTQSLKVAAEQNLTIDLNGHKISAALKGPHMICNAGDLTITDSSAAKTGEIAKTGDPTDYGYVIENHDTMKLESCKISSTSTKSSAIENGWYNPSQNTAGTNCVMTIQDAEVVSVNAEGGLYTIKNDDYGVMVINGGNFVNDSNGGGVVLNWNDLTINNGTFTGASVVRTLKYGSAAYETGKTQINNGTFNGALDSLEGYNEGTDVTVSGGKFSESVDPELLADGLTAELVYSEGENKLVYTYYPTLEDALAAAEGTEGTVNDLKAAKDKECRVTLVSGLNRASTWLWTQQGSSFTLPQLEKGASQVHVGWKDEAGTYYAVGAKYTVPGQDAVLTAVWQSTDIITPVGPSKPSKPTEPTEPTEPAFPFDDVTESGWYYDGVKYAYDNGLMNGTGANVFSPNADTTRGMIVTILARMEGVNTSGGASWYALGSEWAMNAGVSDGTNMEGKITREQLAVMLYRYAKMKGYDVSASADISAYTDASGVSGWAKEAMQWAVGSGLIQGSGSALNPQANASRAEVATILARFAQNLAK